MTVFTFTSRDQAEPSAGLWELLSKNEDLFTESCATETKLQGSATPSSVPFDQKVELKKPKRILNAYNLFFRYHRQQIRDAIAAGNMGAGFGNLAREVAQRWKRAGPEEKAHFTYLYELDKKRHEREMKAWKAKKKSMELQQKQHELLHQCSTTVNMDEKDQRLASVDSNPFLTDAQNMRRLAYLLGDDGVETVIRALL